MRRLKFAKYVKSAIQRRRALRQAQQPPHPKVGLNIQPRQHSYPPHPLPPYSGYYYRPRYRPRPWCWVYHQPPPHQPIAKPAPKAIMHEPMATSGAVYKANEVTRSSNLGGVVDSNNKGGKQQVSAEEYEEKRRMVEGDDTEDDWMTKWRKLRDEILFNYLLVDKFGWFDFLKSKNKDDDQMEVETKRMEYDLLKKKWEQEMKRDDEPAGSKSDGEPDVEESDSDSDSDSYMNSE